jgi:enoyl-CoA hydratase/carnithine racemase
VSEPTVVMDQRGHVALITLSRPERLNAFTPAMHDAYRRLLAEAEADPGVGAVVVTGAGQGFCAGADMDAVGAVAAGRDGAGSKRGSPVRPGYGSHPAFDRPFAYHLGLSKPVIAAVNGAAAGLGFVLACYCDVRIAAGGAKLTPAFGRLGLPAEYGLSWLLPRLIGGSRAVELLLSSRVIEADEAQALGLVHRVVPGNALVDEAVAYAETVAASVAPAALSVTKRQLYVDWMRDLGEAFEDAKARTDEAVRGPEFREGVAAMRERRAPQWRSE